MSDLFQVLKNMITGQKQRPKMTYRPQVNCTAERMVQKITRVIKMYVADETDWGGYAAILMFEIKTAQNGVRGDTPFYLIHG